MAMTEATRRDGFPDLIVTLAIGVPIAAVYPFDRVFEAVAGGMPAIRAVLFAIMIILGAAIGNRAGLAVHSHGAQHPALVGIGAAFAVAIAIVVLDGLIWRPYLPAPYLLLFQTVGLKTRLVAFMLRAFAENVMYRLFLFSCLAYLFGRLWPRAGGLPGPWALSAAMILSQTVNIAINVVAASPGGMAPPALLYDAIRYGAPGVAWALVYRYFGFTTVEIASTSCHVFLQPTLGYLLDRPG
ncbi:MAG TPA: hypothetical protein VM689_19690 [Aliidongia sp.]|nr:hypothetical protein [Aliidongia sp.]